VLRLVGINGQIMKNKFPAWFKEACLPNMTSPKIKNTSRFSWDGRGLSLICKMVVPS